MKSLRVRLTVWFALGFLAVTVIFTLVTYRRLDLELRRGTFAREQNINPNWILHGSYSEEEVHEIMAALIQSGEKMKEKTALIVLGLALVFGGATRSEAQVKRVQMHIAGYLCGN